MPGLFCKWEVVCVRKIILFKLMNYRECQNSKFRFLLIIALCAFLFASCSSQAKQNHITKGEEFLQKRKFNEAVMEFRAAAEIDKNSGDAYWGLARAQENLGDYLSTIDNLRKAIELDPKNLEAKAKLGNYFLASNPPSIADTEKLLEDIFNQDPKFIEGYILKASLFDVQNKPQADVLEILKQAIALNPKRVESYMSLSRYFMKKNDVQRAEKAIIEGIDAGDDKTTGFIEYGKFLVFQNRTDEAEQKYSKAIESSPNNIEAHEAIADFYISQKQFQKAEAQYLELVKIQENSPESRVELANFYERTGRNEEAIKIFNEIIAESPDYARAHYRLAEIYLGLKQYDKVSAEIEKLLAINDSDLEALMLRARLNLDNNKPIDSVSDLETILKKQPSLREGLYFMAQARLALGQPDQARAFIGDLVRYHPNYLRTKLLNIQASFIAGQIEMARRDANELLIKVEKSFPNAEVTSAELEDLRQRALSSRGLANLQLGNLAEAKSDLVEVARLSPNSNAALLNLAKLSIAEKNYSEALSIYEKVLNADGNNFDALSSLVSVLSRQGNFAEANRRIENAMKVQAGKNDVLAALHYLKAEVALAQNNSDEAEQHLNNSITADDNYLPAYSAYASILISKNKTADAIIEYQKLVDKIPTAPVYTLLGMIQESSGNLQEAEKNYRKALEIAPEMPIASNNLAWLIADTGNGNLDEALKLAQTAVDQDQTAANYFDTLGWVYFKKGLYSPAIEQLRRAVALDESKVRDSGDKLNNDYRMRLEKAMAVAGNGVNAKN